MASELHISQVRRLLDTHERCTVRAWTRRGEMIELKDVVPVRYDFRTGTRRYKLPAGAGRFRCVRDILIFGYNEYDVYV